MFEIDTEKISKEMNDTLVHTECVIRSGTYLANYLAENNRSLDAIILIGRCKVHDISKIQNTEEFMNLASIVDEIGEMHDVEHQLKDHQIEAIKLHWKRNSHHPEYYESPNDMTDMDLLEMACDCHARSKQLKTNLLDYITIQQELRFHFDSEHIKKLYTYCEILVKLTKNDDYSSILNIPTKVKFDLKDSTLEMLEHFDDTYFPSQLETERLYLEKEDTPDFASVSYYIYLKETNKRVGEISLKCNAFIEYKIYESYLGNSYASEAIKKIIETSKFKVFKMSVRKENENGIKLATETGFQKAEITENSFVYKLKKK